MGRYSVLSRRRAGRLKTVAALAVMVAALVPVAIAFACNPQANLRLDKAFYAPGERIGISGAFFKGNVDITITVEPNGSGTTVRTTGNGFFATSVTAPSAPGSYTVSAIGYESDGTVTVGLPARASFEVRPTAPAPSTQPRPTQPGATAPRPSQPSAGEFAEPRVPNAAPFPSRGRTQAPTRRGRTGGGRGGVERRAAVVNTGTGVIRQADGGPAVFAGSVARAGRAAAVASPAAKGGKARARGGAATSPAATSERTALSDVWSGLASEKAPSLLREAGEPTPQGTGTGLGFVWGLALIGLSLAALAAGLAAAGARRRARRTG